MRVIWFKWQLKRKIKHVCEEHVVSLWKRTEMSCWDWDTSVGCKAGEKQKNQRSLIESAVAVLGNKCSFFQNGETKGGQRKLQKREQRGGPLFLRGNYMKWYTVFVYRKYCQSSQRAVISLRTHPSAGHSLPCHLYFSLVSLWAQYLAISSGFSLF